MNIYLVSILTECTMTENAIKHIICNSHDNANLIVLKSKRVHNGRSDKEMRTGQCITHLSGSVNNINVITVSKKESLFNIENCLSGKIQKNVINAPEIQNGILGLTETERTVLEYLLSGHEKRSVSVNSGIELYNVYKIERKLLRKFGKTSVKGLLEEFDSASVIIVR